MNRFAIAAVAAVTIMAAWTGAVAQSDAPRMPMMQYHQGMNSAAMPMMPGWRHGLHRGPQHRAAGPAGDDGPSSLAYAGANNKMHRGMAIAYTGDADVDFVRGMIPHHQGAIDMARIVLAFGDDPEVRKLAEGVIAAQEAEIALMRKWLEENGAN